MAIGSPDNHPTVIEGGCLCGAVRYKLHFPYGSAWPPDSHDCQCTQCRKWTGALVCPWIGVKPSQITWPTSSNPDKASATPEGLKHYAEYSSSPEVYRGFCNKCASPFLWRSNEEPENVGLTTGSIDEKVLIGEIDESDPHKGYVGTEAGKDLANPITGGHLWFMNAIKGVTDQVTGGTKYAQGSEGPVIQ